jgi:hypothetical protein
MADHRLQCIAISCKAVIERHRIKAVAKITHIGEHADIALRSFTCGLKHQICDGLFERNIRATVIVGALKPGQIFALVRLECARAEQCWQFIQIQIHHEHLVVERVTFRAPPLMEHLSGINRALGVIHDYCPWQ